MRLQAHWLTHPGTLAVFDALAPHNVWFVGGCVRNGILGLPVDDIDICTDALPETVMDLTRAAGLKAIPTGIDHGTVTIVADGKPHEITTLRRDIETNGRHASVLFTHQTSEDAARRDFTINALYATRNGDVLDPNGEGLLDLGNRHLRFIGDPNARIAEDYLRILRFFRFHAWYADPNGGMDQDALAACAANIDGLTQLSRERVGAEIRKLLLAPNPAPALATMDQTGILNAILPGAQSHPLTVLTGLERNLAADPIRRLAAIGGDDAPDLLRLSKSDTKRLRLYRDEMGKLTTPGALGYLYGLPSAYDILTLRAVAFEQPPSAEAFSQAQTGASATFPIKAADLPDIQGPALGQRLNDLKTRWIDSQFTLTKAALLHE
ncbi:MAG: CCA tRNA nucleotidyltransferase [Roseicyclus sp.]|nr:CCA tRNA nucleotidyltransferase [Roseicyclus sp.]